MTGICNGEDCLLKCSCLHYVKPQFSGIIEPTNMIVCFDAESGECPNYYSNRNIFELSFAGGYNVFTSKEMFGGFLTSFDIC